MRHVTVRAMVNQKKKGDRCLLQIQVSSKSVIWKYIVNALEKYIFNTLLNTASEEYLILNETGNLLRAAVRQSTRILCWGQI